MNKKLDIMATFKEGFSIGALNLLSLILVTILYLITIWIPYINVGTTIAISSLPAVLAKGKVIDPLFIFESKYRRNMGEFFILYALMQLGILVGLFFLLIPGLVIAVAWNFAVVLFVDKDLSAIDALHESNRITYGNKWRIFWITMLFVILIYVVVGIIMGICLAIGGDAAIAVGTVLTVIVVIFCVPVAMGLDASMYRQLTEEPKAEEPQVEAPATEEPKAE